MSVWSQTFTFLDGEWLEGNAPFIGARTHAFWLGSSVFDGARAFEGVTPDLDRHCARLNRSAIAMGLKPVMSEEALVDLAREGVKKFSPGAPLYIRPMYWAEHGAAWSSVPPDPDSTRFCLCLYEAPLPQTSGISITRSPYAKPLGVTAPAEAKAGCLYPNNARAQLEARSRGFDNCLLCDVLGNVAELATANVFMAKDGMVMTPAANGTFLNGVTRQRVLSLLRADGNDARETTLRFSDFDAADEIFVVGNYGKVTPVRRIRRARPAAGTVLSPRPRTLLAICPFVTAKTGQTGGGGNMARLTIRLDFDSGRRLGAGKIALLEAIERTGSISAAGRAHAMSYRRAWMLVDEMNQLFVAPLVAAHHGGAKGGGAHLTEQGRRIVALYRDAEAKMRAAAGKEIEAIEQGLSPAA